MGSPGIKPGEASSALDNLLSTLATLGPSAELASGEAITDSYMLHARVVAANLWLPWHKARGGQIRTRQSANYS